jgi:hypothetical protein
MRHLIIGIWLLCFSVTSAIAQIGVGIGINLPGVNIGINLPAYPDLVRVPGYPVYYAPRLESNFFFYDGMYWVYESDNWYASSWYNGPWGLVGPQSVPVFVLRIPVRYYRSPPSYFHDWRADAPPRWGDHWGNDWSQQRRGWDQWNHRSAPQPAPLPAYQRKYSGDRYPQQVERQQVLRGQNYRYQPRDFTVRQHEQQQRQAQRQLQQKQPAAASPVQREQKPAPLDKGTRPSDFQRGSPPTRPEKAVEKQVQHPTVRDQRSPAKPQQSPQNERGPAQREQRPPEPHQRDQSRREDQPKQEPNRGQGQGQGNDRNRGEERGH